MKPFHRLAGAAGLGLIATALAFLVATYAHGSDIQNQLRLNERHLITSGTTGQLAIAEPYTVLTRPEYYTFHGEAKIVIQDKRCTVRSEFAPVVTKEEDGKYVVRFIHPKDDKPLTVTWLGPILMYSGNSFESVITPSPDYEQGIRSDGVMVWRRIGP